MYFIWFLLGIVLTSLLYSAFQIVKGDSSKHLNYVAPLPSKSTRASASATCFVTHTEREMKWITMKELQALKEKYGDLVILDCRSDTERLALIADSQTVPIKPRQILEVITWLPPHRSAVFCGASDLCAPTMTKTQRKSGVAPVYVLRDDPFHSEVVCGSILQK
jgi:hypothetical protein